MVIAPNNEIILLNVPIEIDNKNQLTFANAQAQFEYFRYIEEQYTYDHCTYVRKDGYIVVNDCYDNLIKYNYCMYQNENFSTKWYYAFILKLEWLSPNSTKVYIKTDVFQTYQFDVNYYASFVEREHIAVSEDVVGANLLPENFEIGEVIENTSSAISGLSHVYVIAYARNPNDGGIDSGSFPYRGVVVNNIASGLFYCICSAQGLMATLLAINAEGFGEDVKAVYTIPAVSVIGLNGMTLSTLEDLTANFAYWIPSVFESSGREFTLTSIPTSLNGYTPRNQKLRQYPFQYLGFTPTNGTSKIFRYEDFQNGTPSFKLVSEVNPNPSVYFIPKNFKGISGVNISESVIVNGYPSIAWSTDFFSNWLAQNSDIVNLELERGEFNYEIGQWKNIFGGVGSAFGAIGSGAAGNIGGAISGIANVGSAVIDYGASQQNHEYDVQMTMAQVEKQSLLPNSGVTGGSNATLLGYSLMNSDIFTRYSIKAQFAERIDLFFDMYGYQTNKVKLPNLNNRPNWNYVKTLGLNVLQKSTANVPQEDLQEFKNIFNNGVTLWHNPQTFLDYSQNNRTT